MVSIENSQKKNDINDETSLQKSGKPSLFPHETNLSGLHVVLSLITANTLIHIIMLLTSGTSILSALRYGANYQPLVMHGEAYRLITSVFLHGDFIHLLVNMYTLLRLGLFLEPLLSRSRFLLIYLLCGIGGSVSSIIFNKLTVSVGASGAVFGLAGYLTGFIFINKDVETDEFDMQIGISILIFIAYNLLSGFSRTGIDNFAHLGGLTTGFLLTYIFKPEKQIPSSLKKHLFTALSAAILIFGLYSMSINFLYKTYDNMIFKYKYPYTWDMQPQHKTKTPVFDQFIDITDRISGGNISSGLFHLQQSYSGLNETLPTAKKIMFGDKLSRYKVAIRHSSAVINKQKCLKMIYTFENNNRGFKGEAYLFLINKKLLAVITYSTFEEIFSLVDKMYFSTVSRSIIITD